MSAERMQQAAALAISREAACVLAVPMSDTVTNTVRGELHVAVAPPSVAPAVLLDALEPPASSASYLPLQHHSRSGAGPATHRPGTAASYDYLCCDPAPSTATSRPATAPSTSSRIGPSPSASCSFVSASSRPRASSSTSPSPAGRAPTTADAQAFEQRVRRAFASIDLDGSGSIGKRQLYEALGAVGIEGSSHQLLALFRDADADRSGQLSYAAFSRLAQKLPQLALLADDRPARAAQMIPHRAPHSAVAPSASSAAASAALSPSSRRRPPPQAPPAAHLPPALPAT